MFELAPHQVDAIKKLGNGKVLVGGVGSGKSITSLAYFTKRSPQKKIYVITTAKKRDSGEWWEDAMMMSLRNDMEVDSWNNIKKYEDIQGACFVFDEQHIVGSGAWVKAFYNIAKHNEWILLSATPADTWMDLIPIFVANGFYRNKTDFTTQHVKWSRFAKYPKVDGYYDTWLLDKLRAEIYVEMPFLKKAKRENHFVTVSFDREAELRLFRDRWNIYEEQPLKDAGEMMRLMRKNVNTDLSRYEALKDIINAHHRVIVFYNHNPELEILRCLHSELDIPVAEWNGHVHQDIPTGDRWVYLVQYQAGEGWNCVTTDTMVFYTLPYSYRLLEQGKGRIDRLNTKYETLHYYIFKSSAIIDKAIWRAVSRKKNFNASAFANNTWPKVTTQP